MFKRFKIYLSLCFLLLCVSSVNAKSTAIQQPLTYSIGISSTIELLDNAVEGALVEKKWLLEANVDSVPRVSHVGLVVGGHKIWSEIKYDLEHITLSYIDSENMNYKEKNGVKYIHPRYNSWSTELFEQIIRNVELGESYFSNIKLRNLSVNSNPPPTEAFSNFTHFKLEDVTLEDSYQNYQGNIGSQKNLNYQLGLLFESKLEQWTKDDVQQRVLIIKPHISAIKFVGAGARVWVKILSPVNFAGRSWIYLSTSFIDEATGEIVAEPELYRKSTTGGVSAGVAQDYAMVDRLASDLIRYIQNNYNKPLGGGTMPPTALRIKIKGSDTVNASSFISNENDIDVTSISNSYTTKYPKLVNSLNSSDPVMIRDAAKFIGEQKIYHDVGIVNALIGTLSRELKVQPINNDKFLIDGLAWCAINLGNAGDLRARSVLVEVVDSSLSKKIRNHAINSLKRLDQQ